MVYDINLKIKDLGDVCGAFRKATQNHVYLNNAILTKAPGIVISSLKIQKKYITSASRMTKPPFELFTDEQLSYVVMMNNPEYIQMIAKILESRRDINRQTQPSASVKQKSEQVKPIQNKQDKKEWNQFEENRRKFGVESKFEVDEYASPIDRNASNFNQAQEKAKKYLRENSQNATAKKSEFCKEQQYSEDQIYSTVQPEDKWNEVLEEKNVPFTPQQMMILDLQRKLDDMNKDLENQQKSGNFEWNKISSLVSKRNALEKEIRNILNPVTEEVKQPIKEDQSSKSKNESNEPVKSKPVGTETKENDTPKKTSEKSNGSNSKKRNYQPEIPATFSSALQIVECIQKNLKGFGKFNDEWSINIASREVCANYFKPLSVFDFPQEEITEGKQKQFPHSYSKSTK